MSAKYLFSKIQMSDADSISKLAIENGGNKNFNSKNLNHWYFKNPSKSNSLWKITYLGRIEGYATTNNFFYTINQERKLVSLPQNVLTSMRIRGKGQFTKLYEKTEQENLEVNKIDFFLTSTGNMSTPIFLKKFGYKRALCPNIIIKPFNLLDLFAPSNFTILDHITQIEINKVYSLNNARIKDLSYFKWRYGKVDKNNIIIIKAHKNDKCYGYAILAKKKIKGIPTLELADIIISEPKDFKFVIKESLKFSSKNFFAATFIFQLFDEKFRIKSLFSLKNRFNFLVKGKTTEETETLSKLKLNYFFGDLDYFW